MSEETVYVSRGRTEHYHRTRECTWCPDDATPESVSELDSLRVCGHCRYYDMPVLEEAPPEHGDVSPGGRR